MSFALVWEFTPSKSGEEDAPVKQVLIGHPGTFSSTDEEARQEGEKILGDEQIEQEYRDSLIPLAIVEVDQDMGDDIQERCEEVEIGSELLFYDLDCYDRWRNQPWWPRA